MKTKAFLYIFFAVILALPSAAFALSAPIGNPVGQWTIGPMNMGKSRGESYCSMKNRFSNDVVLVFARDTSGMNSIAIDFQDSMFEPGREYMVSLDVRRSVTRSVKAMAATSQVLIMQMGYDFVFYEGVRTKNVLQVVVDKTAVAAFSLSGTAKALNALDDCTSALELAPVKNMKLQADAGYAQHGYLDALPPPPSYMAMAGQPAIDVDVHKPYGYRGTDQPVSNATNLELLKQLKALREEVHAMKTSAPTGKPVTQEDVAQRQAQLETEIAALKQSLERTQAVLAQQAEISKAELGKAQQLIGKLEQEKQVLNRQTEVIAANKQREEAMKQTQAELQRELAVLKQELGAAQQMLQASKQEVEQERARRDREMLNRLAALEEENARLKQAVAQNQGEPDLPVMDKEPARIVVRPLNKTTGDVRTAVEKSQRPSLVEMMRPVSGAPETVDRAVVEQGEAALRERADRARRARSVATAAKTVQPPSDGLRRLINAARLPDDGSLRQVRKTRNGNVTFSWETDALFGGASQIAWQKGRDFNEIVESYIATIGRQCLGRFSYNMGKPRRGDDGIVTVGADAVCIDDDQNPAAALLFYGSEERGFFTVISHEGTRQQINTALAKRDAAYMAMRRAF